MPDQQFLLMTLDTSRYALALSSVDEVLRMVALAPKPDGPTWLLGYLNLRGDILPTLDLRVLLGMEPATVQLETPIVIVRSGAQRAGLIVDQVNQVVDLRFNVQGTALTPFDNKPVFLLKPEPYIVDAHRAE